MSKPDDETTLSPIKPVSVDLQAWGLVDPRKPLMSATFDSFGGCGIHAVHRCSHGMRELMKFEALLRTTRRANASSPVFIEHE
ncbi:hypothetical protein [Bradyrhizobium ganzhouense]|uniref:hypothetical protein n=1 Tax=Bradyrhizobium ganzhouense TaxID=1179767 RepID=UPI003CEE13DA